MDLSIFPGDCEVPMTTLLLMGGACRSVAEPAQHVGFMTHTFGKLTQVATIDCCEDRKAKIKSAIQTLADRSLVTLRQGEWKLTQYGDIEWGE